MASILLRGSSIWSKSFDLIKGSAASCIHHHQHTRGIIVQGLLSDDPDMSADRANWLQCGDWTVHPWSISGLESTITVKLKGFGITFDMGYVTKESVNSKNVFISHGHIDHVSGILAHAARRSLYGMPPPTYHVPPHLVEPLRTVAQGTAAMHGPDQHFTDINIHPLPVDGEVQLPYYFKIRPFPTIHRVPSQGYIIYKSRRRLKPEYQHLHGKALGKAVKDKRDMYDYYETPELAYTGDTTFDLFRAPPTPDLLHCPTLITECTYVDDEYDRQNRDGVQRAWERGHCHLRQFADNEQLFADVKHLVLVHLSDKYSVRFIHRKAKQILSNNMQRKVHFGLNMSYQK